MTQDLDLSNIAVAIVEFDSHGHMVPIALSADEALIRYVAKRLVEEMHEHEGQPTARGAMATARLHILRSLAGVPPEAVEGESLTKPPAWWDTLANSTDTEGGHQ
jgi:hypothetical protein